MPTPPHCPARSPTRPARNDSDTVNTTVSRSADLAVDKSGPATANAGEYISYRIDVSNNGPSDGTSATLTDTLSSSLQNATYCVDSGPACDPSLGSAWGGTLAVGALNSGATKTVRIRAQIKPSAAAGTLANTASLSAQSPTDPTSANDSDTVNTTVSRSADLSISKSGPCDVIAGNSITYTLTVHNGGPSDVASFTVTDALPSGLSGAQYCTYNAPATDCTASTSYTGSISGLGSLAANNDLKVKIVATVNSSVADGATLYNQGSVSSATTDPDTSNNTSNNVSTTVSRSADLSISKSGPASVIAGNSITYTLTVHNGGPSDVASFTVTDALPSGLSGAQYCTYNAPATDCTASTSYTGSISGLGSLAANNDLKVKIVATVSTSLVGTTISNQASVSSGTTDPSGLNNTSTVQTSVSKRPTTLTYTGASSAQYSDPAGLKATLKDSATNDPVPSATVTFVVGTQTMTATTDALGVATTDDAVANRLNQPAGSKTLTVSSTGTMLYAPPINATGTYQVNAEDATVSDFSPPNIAVGTAGGTASPTITMTVAEANDGYPSGAVTPTNGLQKAPVSLALSPVGSGSGANCGPATPTATSPTATATCGPINNLAVNVYEIDATIGASPAIGGAVAGTYFAGTGIGVITVMDPSLGFTTGGGWFNYTDPSNSANNAKVNFGFNAKILKSGQVQGSVLTIFKRSNGNYIVKSNSMGGLAISRLGTTTPAHYSASLTGKATYAIPITDPKLVTPSCTDWKCGNYTFTVYVEDLNEPGSGYDRYWIQVKDPSTAQVVVPKASINGPSFTTGTQATNWAQTILGGNIQVPQPQGPK